MLSMPEETEPDKPASAKLRVRVMTAEKDSSLPQLFSQHLRCWQSNLYVYPVISRRSRGLSIGLNLNPDKACNFDCIYCQVPRDTPSAVRLVDVNRLRDELEHMVQAAVDGSLFQAGPLSTTPLSHRVIRDFAFSGDGEPTTCPHFVEAVQVAADVRGVHHLEETKLVLITDAAYLDRPKVQAGLAILDAHNGEIWAKLDAGTQDYFQQVNRPNVTLDKVTANITGAAQTHPIVIQSMWMRIHGQPPPADEIDAFAQRVAGIQQAGGRIKLVQLYTIARQTAEPYVNPLTDAELADLAERVRRCCTAPLAIFGAS